jgi:hypothetical protein
MRVGSDVLRPGSAQTEAVHALLRFVRRAGFEGVPTPVGIELDGRERLRFIEGDVPIPPYPRWAQADEVLASMASLLRGFHDATSGFEWPEDTWSNELRDPRGGAVMCHNDVCLENVVFRHGVAIALLDFDHVAPGRAIFDLAQFARMCVPLEDPEDTLRLKGMALDPVRRLRIVAHAYEMRDSPEEFLDAVGDSMAVGQAFVEQHVARRERAFVQMWRLSGGQARFERRKRWFDRQRPELLAALR